MGQTCNLLPERNFFSQVHAFNVMMRQVNRTPHFEDLKIGNNDLQDYFQDALEKFRNT